MTGQPILNPYSYIQNEVDIPEKKKEVEEEEVELFYPFVFSLF